jgi:hypothetical protein
LYKKYDSSTLFKFSPAPTSQNAFTFSSVKNKDEGTGEWVLVEEVEQRFLDEHKRISNDLKKVFLKIHPDLFRSFPDAQKLNEESISKMNHFCDAIENFIHKLDQKTFQDLDSPVKLKFVYKNNKNGKQFLSMIEDDIHLTSLLYIEYKMFTTNIFLPFHLLSGTPERQVGNMVRFYDDCVKDIANAIIKGERRK